ncbi:MAG TPA: type II secretion system F family protein [Phycisphaerae bacterium]|nr:type II secretion system F family protein [Phycisphaerae bacterium]
MIPAQFFIPILVFVAVMAIGAGILLARSIRLESLRTRLGTATPDEEAEPAEKGPLLLRITGRLGGLMGVHGTSQNLRKLLARAGYHGDTPVVVFLGSKVLLLLAALGVGAALTYSAKWTTATKSLVVLGGATFFFFLPNMLVRLKGSRRTSEIRVCLPDAVDLLEICVSSGMGLDQAWNVVTEKISSVSMLLGDEMAFTNLEIHMGAPRSLAMRHLGERTGCQEASSLAAALTQSEQFGTSIAETLKTFASSMRETRSMMAQEFAEKLAVKLLFPLVFLIFPAIIIVVCGPAGIEWAKVLSGAAGR